MPKIRIEYYYIEESCDHDYSEKYIKYAPEDTYSEWGEVTLEELKFLKQNIKLIPKIPYKAQIVIATAVTTPEVKESIKEIKERVEEAEKQLAIKIKEAKQRIKEREDQKKEKERLKKLKQLEKLKKELET